MNKKVLITGGAGFIGSAVYHELVKNGYEPFVIDNLSFGNRDFIDINDLHFFEVDILSTKKVNTIISQIDPIWVIHLAAVHFIPYCNEHPYESANINIRGTMNILNATRFAPSVKKVFMASTAAVYPIYDEAVTEKHEVGPLDIYGLSKLTCEHLCNEFHLKTKVDTVICRFFNAFGPNETNAHLIPEIQQQINTGARTIKLGNLEPKRDFIHTHDMARAVRMLLESNINGIDTFNLGRGIEYSVTEIVHAFQEELEEKINIEQESSRIRKVERMHLLADVSKLQNFTGWKPEWGINDGIKTLINK